MRNRTVITKVSFNTALAGFVYGVTPTEPVVFLAVGAMLALTAALATYVRALGAGRVDPMIAMRQRYPVGHR